MAFVRERWLSRRAVSLHLAVLVFVPGCAVAAWWQIHRAQDGNQLSYLYSVMWPVFGILGLYFWWMLLHTDYETVGLKGMRRQQEAAAADDPRPGPIAVAPPAPPAPAPILVEDPELAAYNARLAALAAKGPKTWRAREKVVVRREQ
jgi:DNA-binding transcriptional regulator of glucitol operon